jgi:hypothetical protein
MLGVPRTREKMTKAKVTIILLVLILLAGCQKEKEVSVSQPAQPPPQAQAQKQPPHAMEIAAALKAAGVPFLKNPPGMKDVTLPVDGSPGTKGSMIAVNNPGGIISQATTATANADVDITVFSSREKLQQAQQRMEAMDHRTQHDKDLKLGTNVYNIVEGCIWVTLAPDIVTANVPGEGKVLSGKRSKTLDQYAETIRKTLKQKYGD